MARAVRGSVKTKGRAKPTRRARRVTVAKEKSRPRGRTSARAAAARTETVEPAAVKAGKAKPGKAEPAPAKPALAKRALAKARAKVAKVLKRAKPEQAAAARPAPAPLRARKPAPTAEAPSDEVAPATAPGLTDEEQIESAKYQPRRVPPRVFEEERFLFPQSYGVNRLRLLVKDPEWLFAYWDVDPRSLEALRSELGARTQALSQLTLRVFEDRTGGASTFLLPQDARTWYVPVRTTGRAYRAEVGIILPTGEFRPLARSNSAATPRVGRSTQKAKKRVRYDRVRPSIAAGAAAVAAGEEIPGAEDSWDVPLDAGAAPEEEKRPSARSRGGAAVERGGASDLHRR